MSAAEAEILGNAIRTPDGTVIRSLYRHDFVCHRDANGYMYCVDGGLDYLKRSYDPAAPAAVECSVYEDDPHEQIREALHWGRLCADGEREYSALKDMSTDHIRACLRTQTTMRWSVRRAMEAELVWRDHESET